MDFEHQTQAQRTVLHLGRAAENIRAELGSLGAESVMVVAEERNRPLLDDLAAVTTVAWTDVVQHVPVELATRATAAAEAVHVDAIVAIGGGSAIGLAKAIALNLDAAIIAVPTTFAGSEATSVWGLTDDAGKRTGSADRVLPRVVVYDATLTATMPPDLAVASGLNAVAHCVDALWAPRADPINAALASEGLRALNQGLRSIRSAPDDLEGRQQAQYGCYLAAVAFSSAGSAMHHKICHVLGGLFNLPHAATHAVVLAYVLAFNGPAAPEATRRIAAALDATDAHQGLEDLRRTLGAPRALKDIGLREADIAVAVPQVLAAIPPSNPRPVSAGQLSTLLHAAWAGETIPAFLDELAA